jgi:hypothetical protein
MFTSCAAVPLVLFRWELFVGPWLCLGCHFTSLTGCVLGRGLKPNLGFMTARSPASLAGWYWSVAGPKQPCWPGGGVDRRDRRGTRRLASWAPRQQRQITGRQARPLPVTSAADATARTSTLTGAASSRLPLLHSLKDRQPLVGALIPGFFIPSASCVFNPNLMQYR